jgi:VIT1/CCC1 family predicted Fe2+/Mn2+ transporter
MSSISALFLAAILQFAIPAILVFHFLKGDESDNTWWKVNSEAEPISAGGMFVFFSGVSSFISAMVFGLPVVLNTHLSGFVAALIITLVGLIGFIVGKFVRHE